MNIDRTLFGVDLTRADAAMAKALTRAIKSSNYSRDQMASILSIQLGRKITINTLNNITSTAKPHHADINLVKAICIITGDVRPQELFLDGTGSLLIPAAEVPVYEMHRLLMERKRIDEQLADLEGQIDHGSK